MYRVFRCACSCIFSCLARFPIAPSVPTESQPLLEPYVLPLNAQHTRMCECEQPLSTRTSPSPFARLGPGVFARLLNDAHRPPVLEGSDPKIGQ